MSHKILSTKDLMRTGSLQKVEILLSRSMWIVICYMSSELFTDDDLIEDKLSGDNFSDNKEWE